MPTKHPPPPYDQVLFFVILTIAEEASPFGVTGLAVVWFALEVLLFLLISIIIIIIIVIINI